MAQTLDNKKENATEEQTIPNLLSYEGDDVGGSPQPTAAGSTLSSGSASATVRVNCNASGITKTSGTAIATIDDTVGDDYYVDSVSGNDTWPANDGSFSNPWASFTNINGISPNVTLQPGDTVYIRGGDYEEVSFYQDSGRTYNDYATLVLESITGTAANPINIKGYHNGTTQEHPYLKPPVVNPPTYNGENVPTLDSMAGIGMKYCSYINFEYIEIEGASFHGAEVFHCDHINFRKMVVHDTNGDSWRNMSGILFDTCTDWNVYESVFYDNYCLFNQSHDNQASVAFYEGGRFKVYDNIFYSAVDTWGSGFRTKYVTTGTIDPLLTGEVYNNYFENIGLATHSYQGAINIQAYARAHHNLIVSTVGHGMYQLTNGDNDFTNIEWDYNTIISRCCLMLHPAALALIDSEFHHNICYSTAPNDNYRDNSITLNYSNTPMYSKFYNGLSSDNNCFYSPSNFRMRFDQALNTVAQWQAENNGGQQPWGANSSEEEPAFTNFGGGDYTITGGFCIDKGCYTGTDPSTGLPYSPPRNKNMVFG